MLSRNSSDEVELWAARRLRRASDALDLAIGDLNVLAYVAHRPDMLLTPEAGKEIEALRRIAVALCKRVQALNPLPKGHER